MNKNIFSKITSVGLGLLVLAGCNDLNPEIEGGYVTTDQKLEAVSANPEMLVAGVAGTSSLFSTYMTVYDAHFDFGYPSLMLALDSRGIDMRGLNIGYNWFSWASAMSDATITGRTPALAWYHIYKQIYAANTILETLGTESDDLTQKFYIAQGFAFRAFDYFQLAQLFQFTYKGHEDELCVPVITEENSSEAAANGCPRATVRKTYEQILSDLNAAIDNLKESGIDPSDVLGDKPKRLVSLATAYGLRARVNLVMNNWNEAAADASAAIKAFKGKPYSREAVAVPSFSSLTDPAWMWGIAIAETDRVVTSGIVNWPSHMGSLNYGYASVGAWRQVSTTLYDLIPDTDVRKGWFLDANSESVNLSAPQMAYVERMSIPPYTQVKFAPYKDEVATSTNSNDIPLMRIEEMYYILAEGQAMGTSAAEGVATLTEFVQTYRNPSYVCLANDAAGVQDEIWNQRRMEFWGEGISYFDIMRLKKGIDRRGGGWPSVWVYNVPSEDNVLRLPIPEREVQNNPLLGENNPVSDKPVMVADE